jgi:hypothetical protein
MLFDFDCIARCMTDLGQLMLLAALLLQRKRARRWRLS